MSSAFMILLLDELPEGWTLDLANPDEWEDGDEFEHSVPAVHAARHPPHGNHRRRSDWRSAERR